MPARLHAALAGPTAHAADRAHDRFGVPRRHARAYVADALARSHKLPWRYGAELIGRPTRRIKGHRDIRVAGAMLLVTRGKTVLTVWQLTPDELATVLVWQITGVWVGVDAVYRCELA